MLQGDFSVYFQINLECIFLLYGAFKNFLSFLKTNARAAFWQRATVVNLLHYILLFTVFMSLENQCMGMPKN